MVFTDNPEITPQYAYVINYNNNEEKYNNWEKDLREKLKEIEEKHFEHIPDPFNENILKEKISTDSTSSLSIRVSEAKEIFGNELKNKIKNIDDSMSFNIVINSDPNLSESFLENYNYNNLDYSLLFSKESDDKKFQYFYTPLIRTALEQ